MEFVNTEIQYLEYEDVVQLHQMSLEKYGGLPGVHKEKLQAKLALPYSGFLEYERYPTIEEKAAVYLYYLASDHCFFDGNKRIAYVATYTFLDWNGYDLVANDDEIFHFVLTVANHKTRPPFTEVVSWIRKHMIKREE